ncbi:MAG: dihydroorotase [Candidatus Marinimicrobia bacterium]|jgi:dihydroorotase|nr:dihydroorotase [Candidatus Neomarinimicrobiota bacterium]
MIDPHVHLRDWRQANKETVCHGLKIADEVGLDAVFEMPNTDPPIIDRNTVMKRIKLADSCNINIFHGLYIGLTIHKEQITEAVKLHKKLFPRVVGLKLYAGPSTGSLAVKDHGHQKFVFRTLKKLNYNGVVAVHCEDETLFESDKWIPHIPITHSEVRPPEAEISSVKNILKIAQDIKFDGSVHICHISVPGSVTEIEKAREQDQIKVSCGITFHHALLYKQLMKKTNGIFLKVNPPLRDLETQKKMFQMILDKKIDVIETDHAPHQLVDKLREPYSSGISALPFYTQFIQILKENGMSDNEIDDLTHNNINKIFNMNIQNTHKNRSVISKNEYEYDPFDFLNK